MYNTSARSALVHLLRAHLSFLGQAVGGPIKFGVDPRRFVSMVSPHMRCVGVLMPEEHMCGRDGDADLSSPRLEPRAMRRMGSGRGVVEFDTRWLVRCLLPGGSSETIDAWIDGAFDACHEWHELYREKLLVVPIGKKKAAMIRLPVAVRRLIRRWSRMSHRL